MSEVRSVALNLSSRELIFLQKVTRQEYHFITDEEQEARLRLRDKLLEGFFDQNENRIVLNLTRDELLFLIKVARENYSFIVRTEKEARLALAAKLHKTAEAVFGSPADEYRPGPGGTVYGCAGEPNMRSLIWPPSHRHVKSALVLALTAPTRRARRRMSAGSPSTSASRT